MIDLRLGNSLDIAKELETGSVQTIVTSPPYWGLRDYGVTGQLGLERTPEEYVCHLVELFRELRRALKDDGTLWLNLGDSYGAKSHRNNSNRTLSDGYVGAKTLAKQRIFDIETGLKEKDLVGIPWRVAFALQADGWFLRSDVIEEVELYCPCGCGHVMEERIWRHSPDRDIIWHKPNPMPESVTDRPTKSHEYIFLLSKSPKYYYDADAVKERALVGHRGTDFLPISAKDKADKSLLKSAATAASMNNRTTELITTRNRRSVWTVTTRPFKGAHFATFPEALIEPCILAGTSAKGECPKCGAAWVRVTEKGERVQAHWEGTKQNHAIAAKGKHGATSVIETGSYQTYKTIGWKPQCACGLDPVPQIVLDPFNGAGTTGVVAKKHGRSYIGIELNPEYLEMARDRLDATPLPLPVSHSQEFSTTPTAKA